MTYSLWFPTHSVDGWSVRGWLDLIRGQTAYRLDREGRLMVARAIGELCGDRGWRLVSIEPGDLDVAVVVDCEARPERVVHDFKIAASLALASIDGLGPSRKRFNRRARVRYVGRRVTSVVSQ